MAAGLRNNKTNTIGLILPKISMYFHAAVVTVVQNLLHARRYNLIIGQSNDDPAMEKELVETFFSARVDALIVSCTLQTENFSHFDIFSTHQIPILFYDRVPPESYPAHVIKGDDFSGGYLAGKHLAEAGCKRIGLICGTLTSNLYQGRSEGFLYALKQYNLQVDENIFFYQQLTPEDTQSSMKTMFSGKNNPDGLFITSDRAAVAVIQYAKEHQISIPDDLKVIGYSNDPVTAVITPSITTVEQYPAVFGEKLVATLIGMLADNGSQTTITPIITPVELIKRDSA